MTTQASCPVELRLLGGFRLSRLGRPLPITAGGERLLALLALHGGPVSRRVAAGTLWPDKHDHRAAGNLRSVIWRLPPGLVEATAAVVALGPGVCCDVADLVTRSRRLIGGTPGTVPADLDPDRYGADLLPSWSEDWVGIERERLRQLRIHALEALTARLIETGRYHDAIAAGLSSVAADPLRESAHRMVISAHLAEGNRSEALRHYDRFRELLADELGLEPSPRLTGLIRQLQGG